MTLLELYDVEIWKSNFFDNKFGKWCSIFLEPNIQPNEFSNYSNFIEIHPINILQNYPWNLIKSSFSKNTQNTILLPKSPL